MGRAGCEIGVFEKLEGGGGVSCPPAADTAQQCFVYKVTLVPYCFHSTLPALNPNPVPYGRSGAK